jgi:hypothetical protein
MLTEPSLIESLVTPTSVAPFLSGEAFRSVVAVTVEPVVRDVMAGSAGLVRVGCPLVTACAGFAAAPRPEWSARATAAGAAADAGAAAVPALAAAAGRSICCAVTGPEGPDPHADTRRSVLAHRGTVSPVALLPRVRTNISQAVSWRAE